MPDNPERDIMDLVSARLREQSADEFWRRLYAIDEKTISFAGRLRQMDIQDYVRAKWFAKQFHQPWLNDLVDIAIAMSASIKGKGREEGVKAMVGSVEQKTRAMFRLKKEQ